MKTTQLFGTFKRVHLPVICNSGLQDFYLSFLALLLVFGMFFAWETRKVRVEALNDSKQIGLCVYNVLIMSAIAVILSMVSDLQLILTFHYLCLPMNQFK